MVNKLRRDWQLGRVRAGDGRALADFRWWQLMSRSVFFVDLPEPDGEHGYAVDVRYLANPKTKKEHNDGVGKSPVGLYRDGVQIARSNLPATVPVPGGVIEVAASAFGLKRLRFVPEDGGADRTLRPHRRSQEARRARFDRSHPVVSRLVATATVAVLLVALTVGLLHAVELITRVPPVAQHIGTFSSPVNLPTGGTVTLGVAAFLSAMERATRLKHHWLLDSVAS